MEDPDHYRYFVPHDPELQRKLLSCYHDSSLGIHRGRDETLPSLAQDYYWPNMCQHVRSWIRHCLQCIRFNPIHAGISKTRSGRGGGRNPPPS